MTTLMVCLLVCAFVCILVLAALRIKGDVTPFVKVPFLMFSLDAKEKKPRTLRQPGQEERTGQ